MSKLPFIILIVFAAILVVMIIIAFFLSSSPAAQVATSPNDLVSIRDVQPNLVPIKERTASVENKLVSIKDEE